LAPSVGIDFGTSNSAVATAASGVPTRVPVGDGSDYLPTALYAAQADLPSVTIDDSELESRVAAARREQLAAGRAAGKRRLAFRSLSDEELRTRERAIMTREALEAARLRSERASTAEVLLGADAILIGDAAIEQHVLDPRSGRFFRSPKRFLGSDLARSQLAIFERVIAAILAALRDRTAERLGTAPAQVVLGRPVTYSDVGGAERDAQAIQLMTGAAHEAGFTDVESLLEPVAAALEYERSLGSERIALVVDIGGGTTDCTVIRLGPERRARADRSADVLGQSGSRRGGVSLDEALAWQAFMPLFGRDLPTNDGRPLPRGPIHDAVLVYDVPAQTRFFQAAGTFAAWEERVDDPRPLRRLQRLSRGRLTQRLLRSAELTKIALTDEPRGVAALDYVERGLGVTVARAELAAHSAAFLGHVVRLARDALRDAAVRPDAVYVTGGTARSPIVQAALREALGGEVEIVIGDLFGSVVSGLALHAERVFGSDVRG
jgi:hypothetical chaperone protein